MSIGVAILTWLCVFWLGLGTLWVLVSLGYVAAQGIGSHLHWRRVRRMERKAEKVRSGGRP